VVQVFIHFPSSNNLPCINSRETILPKMLTIQHTLKIGDCSTFSGLFWGTIYT
jgi:hypothetical protein